MSPEELELEEELEEERPPGLTRRLFRLVSRYYEKHAVAIDLALVTAGAAAIKRQIEAIHDRLGDLEERGLVPIDDLVTIRDVAKLDRRVWVLEGESGPDPAAAFEDPPAELEGEQPATSEPPAAD